MTYPLLKKKKKQVRNYLAIVIVYGELYME